MSELSKWEQFLIEATGSTEAADRLQEIIGSAILSSRQFAHISKLISDNGRPRCMSSACSFYNSAVRGCWMPNAVDIRDGRCMQFTTIPLEDIFPRTKNVDLPGQSDRDLDPLDTTDLPPDPAAE